MIYKTTILLFALLVSISTPIFAATNTASKTNSASIALLEQPNDNARVVANIPHGQALVPIFSQNGWVKVGDPSNGNVGWVDSKALQAQGYPLVYMQMNSNKNGNKSAQSYQVIQYSGSQSMNQAQIQKIMNNSEQQQADVQKTMNKVMQQNIKDIDALNRDFNQMQILTPAQRSKKVPNNN
jgi:hypothetical protein